MFARVVSFSHRIISLQGGCPETVNEIATEDRKMRKGLTEIVFILDRSGSMSGLEVDTIGGFNSMIAKQKKEEGEAYVSTVLFDDRSEVLHDRVPMEQVPVMTENEYYVRGCTALLDAVGGAIRHIANVHKYAREEDRPEKTLFAQRAGERLDMVLFLKELYSRCFQVKRNSRMQSVPYQRSYHLTVRPHRQVYVRHAFLSWTQAFRSRM